jgi:hypothetical protein
MMYRLTQLDTRSTVVLEKLIVVQMKKYATFTEYGSSY